ncbi:MAG TPA: hypothetical protein VM328_01795 [Fimbriimonadaceae bacterium]|nr:hypothetical protein [Fimbriimonadaceae bacterium]
MTMHGEAPPLARLRVRWHLIRCQGCHARRTQFAAASDLLASAMQDYNPFLQVAVHGVTPSRSRGYRTTLLLAILLLAAIGMAWLSMFNQQALASTPPDTTNLPRPEAAAVPVPLYDCGAQPKAL